MSLKEFVTIVSFCVYLKSFITQKDYRNIDLIMYNFTFKRERKYVHILRSQKLMPYMGRNVARWGIHFSGIWSIGSPRRNPKQGALQAIPCGFWKHSRNELHLGRNIPAGWTEVPGHPRRKEVHMLTMIPQLEVAQAPLLSVVSFA